MKANAPEKIYLVPFGRPIVEPLPKEGGSDVETIWSRSPYDNKEAGNIEYTRTDAFIEKAAEWIEKNFNMPDDFKEHFKKAMKL